MTDEENIFSIVKQGQWAFLLNEYTVTTKQLFLVRMVEATCPLCGYVRKHIQYYSYDTYNWLDIADDAPVIVNIPSWISNTQKSMSGSKVSPDSEYVEHTVKKDVEIIELPYGLANYLRTGDAFVRDARTRKDYIIKVKCVRLLNYTREIKTICWNCAKDYIKQKGTEIKTEKYDMSIGLYDLDVSGDPIAQHIKTKILRSPYRRQYNNVTEVKASNMRFIVDGNKIRLDIVPYRGRDC